MLASASDADFNEEITTKVAYLSLVLLPVKCWGADVTVRAQDAVALLLLLPPPSPPSPLLLLLLPQLISRNTGSTPLSSHGSLPSVTLFFFYTRRQAARPRPPGRVRNATSVRLFSVNADTPLQLKPSTGAKTILRDYLERNKWKTLI